MSIKIRAVEEAIEKIRKINNLTTKQAEKIVNWIIETDEKNVLEVSNAFMELKRKIKYCILCGYQTEEQKCSICNDNLRSNILFIVENSKVIDKMEKANIYDGKYFIFNKTITDERILEESSELIEKLIYYAKDFEEVIIGISPTLGGELTSQVLKKQLKDNNIKVSQLAIGLPVGSSVDYIDTITLEQSIRNRTK
ncbi:recombination protein RecR [Mycoplasma anatis]|uniref:toprim domain-containing protein n=1 Tax=Mycoplasmopsis anatis TaxID=171279 RepID=UPI001C4E1E03|nr:toprim domain-containing protein [Mycoplasmopsis anatis]MBW0595992.1 recombination protein RecR [Mycoplasmopsis anatis]MBW0597491.1 recombination protein RecR [Mycoplasmopsis anatis]MBW0599736.1 recombination protein RecR [Mycoplasmopsis anatis]MBW0600350.1 recombination protein RecR [Mycoplasmopsis anatis]